MREIPEETEIVHDWQFEMLDMLLAEIDTARVAHCRAMLAEKAPAAGTAIKDLALELDEVVKLMTCFAAGPAMLIEAGVPPERLGSRDAFVAGLRASTVALEAEAAVAALLDAG
jgi:hypothetical protein